MASVVKNLFYKVGDFELHIPHWSFSSQGVTALTGVSGSGKTTLLKILSGLLPCPRFSWNLGGIEMSSLTPPERQLGVCFQDLRLFPHMTARENILFALQARSVSFKEKKEDFEDMMDFLGLGPSLDLFIESLSGGERKRVALARALILRPRFLFLDEPFSYLDEASKVRARKLTSDLVKKYSVPLLLVSHDSGDIDNLADEEFFLKEGRIYKTEKSL